MALVLANVFLTVLVPKKSKQKGFMNPSKADRNPPEETEAEVIYEKQVRNEETALVTGTINSLSQKMTLVNNRLLNLENVVSILAKEKIDSETNQQNKAGLNAIENKKLKDISDFKEDAKIRLEVIESELEKLRGQPLIKQKKLETFDEKTEEKIRSLVFNTNRKQ
jgi:hypothetical protein